jgi:type III restriction enzyme
VRADEREPERTLIVEVSGGRKDQAKREVKAQTARDQWCVAVNNHKGFGVWGFVEIDNMVHPAYELREAIDDLYADGVTTGGVAV